MLKSSQTIFPGHYKNIRVRMIYILNRGNKLYEQTKVHKWNKTRSFMGKNNASVQLQKKTSHEQTQPSILVKRKLVSSYSFCQSFVHLFSFKKYYRLCIIMVNKTKHNRLL